MLAEAVSLKSEYRQIKSQLHAQMLDDMDLESLAQLGQERARVQVRQAIQDRIRQNKSPLSHAEREQIADAILDELFGLGPLEQLLADPEISDILVNGHSCTYIERGGKLSLTDVQFDDDEHLMGIISRIVARVGRRVDESTPMVDARLQDGSRVNAIVPPLALDGPVLSIRRFGRKPLSADNLLENNTLTPAMLKLLEAAVRARLSVLISGGTGAGKTTLLNVISSFIPQDERLITIEDAAELQLKQNHVVRLETRPPNIEGKGAILQRHLVINALRMRPDRIIVGEVRGEEAIDMLQAMNTGHEGSLTTIHSNSPRDAINRLETMVSMANLNLPDKAVRQQIASSIELVVQVSRLTDGSRRIINISEVTGMEGPVVTMQDLFLYRRQGFDEDGKVRGHFAATGIRPKFGEKLFAAGIRLPEEMFLNEI